MPKQEISIKEAIKKEYIKCATDPVYFMKKYYYIQHPQKGRMLFNLFPFQEQVLKQIIKGEDIIINKSRQLGISTLVSAYSLWLMLFHSDKNILCIATSQLAAQNLITKVVFSYDQLPAWLKVKEHLKSKSLLKLTNGSQIQAKAATDNAARSEAVSMLIIDEAAFIDNIEKIYVAAQQTLATGGNCIALSSPNGTGNWFYTTFISAQDRHNNFLPIKLPWQVHPERNQEWRDRQDVELGKKNAAQECDAEFTTSGNSVIDTDVLNYYVDNFVKDPLEKRGIDGNLWIFEYPDLSRTYATVCDVARGDGADSSTIHVFDIEACRQVAEYKGQVSTKDFAHIIKSVGYEYNEALAIVENNSIGWDVLNRLVDMNYPNLYHSPKTEGNLAGADQYLFKQNQGVAMVPGFSMNLKTRPLVVSKIISFMNEYSVDIRSKRTTDELRTFIYKNGRPEAARGNNDDLVMPLGVFLFLRETTLQYHQQGIEMSRATLGSISSVRSESPKVYRSNLYEENPYKMDTGIGGMEDISWLLK